MHRIYKCKFKAVELLVNNYKIFNSNTCILTPQASNKVMSELKYYEIFFLYWLVFIELRV